MAKNAGFAGAALTAAAFLSVPGAARAGGELQTRTVTETQQTVTQPGAMAAAPGTQPYRFCIPYPYNGPGRYPCSMPNGMTHYAPGGWNGGGGYVYPGYAYAGHHASGMGPGPFLTGAVVGLTLGAHIF